ncbi:hypothetical protein HYPDE_29243 [Hyphomicrobium denitrificans 1NES1]|uniref:Uncharacterized protein n=1 Tax=Hyphomicrobium denitrificans 1NES1 TaxID=670307 RepID=N0B236_9HYPH|nr:hypothetical protein HYPDE_29243 [Hyphomicrobium denitrificans 1NES1]
MASKPAIRNPNKSTLVRARDAQHAARVGTKLGTHDEGGATSICAHCGADATLVTGETVYPKRPDLHEKPFYYRAPCQAWVGCHPGTTKPLGTAPTTSSGRPARTRTRLSIRCGGLIIDRVLAPRLPERSQGRLQVARQHPRPRSG